MRPMIMLNENFIGSMLWGPISFIRWFRPISIGKSSNRTHMVYLKYYRDLNTVDEYVWGIVALDYLWDTLELKGPLTRMMIILRGTCKYSTTSKPISFIWWTRPFSHKRVPSVLTWCVRSISESKNGRRLCLGN